MTEPLTTDDVGSHARTDCSHGMAAHDRLGCFHCACRTPGFGLTEAKRDRILDAALLAEARAEPRAEGLREALMWLRGDQDSIGRFSRDHIGTVVRLNDVLALLGLAHSWPPATVGDVGVCSDCGEFWPCQYAIGAGSALRAALTPEADHD